jgi:hypothetical protein
MLDRNLELFKSRFCVAAGKRIDLSVLRRVGRGRAAVIPGYKPGAVGKQHPQSGKVPTGGCRGPCPGANDGDVAGVRLHTTRHPPRKRRVQYAAASRLNMIASGILRVMTVVVCQQTCMGILAAPFARGLLSMLDPLESEGAGKAGCALHPRSRVQIARVKAHTSIQVQRRHPTFPAQWSSGLYVISPVTGLSCHRHP